MEAAVKLVLAEINEGKNRKEYIAIENNTGVLLVDQDLFVLSFADKKEIPYYEVIANLSTIKDKDITLHRN